MKSSGDSARTAAVSRRLEILELLAGIRPSGDMPKPAASQPWPTTPIPGPLRSFARMAAISPDALPEEVLPALARNVVTNGYEASHSNEALEQTEYLKLVHRYLSQARELEKLAGDRQSNQDRDLRSPEGRRPDPRPRLPHARRLRSEVVLETVNAARAFLTTDSGFPWISWKRRCAPTARSLTITIRRRCPCCSGGILD